MECAKFRDSRLRSVFCTAVSTLHTSFGMAVGYLSLALVFNFSEPKVKNGILLFSFDFLSEKKEKETFGITLGEGLLLYL